MELWMTCLQLGIFLFPLFFQHFSPLVSKLTLALVSDIFIVNKPCHVAVTQTNHTFSIHQSRASSIITRAFFADDWLWTSCMANDECTTNNISHVLELVLFKFWLSWLVSWTIAVYYHLLFLGVFPLIIMYNQSVGRDDTGIYNNVNTCTGLYTTTRWARPHCRVSCYIARWRVWHGYVGRQIFIAGLDTHSPSNFLMSPQCTTQGDVSQATRVCTQLQDMRVEEQCSNYCLCSREKAHR